MCVCGGGDMAVCIYTYVCVCVLTFRQASELFVVICVTFFVLSWCVCVYVCMYVECRYTLNYLYHLCIRSV